PKTYGLEESLALAPPRRVGDALVVPLVNGVEHMDWLRQAYPGAQVVAGVIRVESERLDRGHVVQRTPFIRVGLAATSDQAARVRALAAEVAATGMTVQVVDDEKRLLWEKLAFLAPTALATSAVGETLGGVRKDAAVIDLMEGSLRETVAVAAAEGATL